MSEKAKLENIGAGEPEPLLDITNDTTLAEALTAEEPNIADLALRAEALLNETGKVTTIDGLSVTATPESSPVKLRDNILHARLARYLGSTADFPSIVFCTNDDFSNLQTTNNYFSALVFRKPAEEVHLVAGNGYNPVVDKDEHVKIAQTIIDDLAGQNRIKVAAEKQKTIADEKKAAEIAEEKRIAAIEKRENILDYAIFAGEIVGYVALVGALLWGPQALDIKHIDAKIGPVWMPDFVEWLVDANNMPDHRATGFPQPAGALPLSFGTSVNDVPFLTNYNANNAPQATFHSISASAIPYDESKPGLYSSNFNFDKTKKDSKPADFCYDIRGNYILGKTVVFTQTPHFNDAVTLDIKTSNSLEVCKKPSYKDSYSGSVLLYQKH
jgi:hypothetical protein